MFGARCCVGCDVRGCVSVSGRASSRVSLVGGFGQRGLLHAIEQGRASILGNTAMHKKEVHEHTMVEITKFTDLCLFVYGRCAQFSRTKDGL